MTRRRRDDVKRVVLVLVALVVSGIHTFDTPRARATAVGALALIAGSALVFVGVWIADHLPAPRIAPRGRR
jgi:hypothetical protein